MNIFERYLSIWVALCIAIGIALGNVVPGQLQALGRMEVAQVNIPVGILIWVMIISMLLTVDFGALHQVREHVKGIGVTLFVNWFIKPFSMAFLAWLFISQFFAPLLPHDQLDSYVAGLILLAAVPSALFGASDFLELAVAAAISMFGFESGAALLATVVGVLIEVLVVRVVNATKPWYEAKATPANIS